MWKKLALAILFCCLIQPLSVTGQGAPTQGTAMMSEAQALSMIRSKKASAPDVGLIVVQRIEPDPGTRAVAMEALAQARSKHLHLEEHGLLANLMRVGGYIVLEYSQRSERVIQLHFATQGEAGEPQFESWYLAPPDKTYDSESDYRDLHEDLGKDEALMLIRRNEEFSKAFFTSAPSQLAETMCKFGSSGTPHLSTFGLGCEGIPERLTKLAAPPVEMASYCNLLHRTYLWLVRYALTLPVFAANPDEAMSQAEEKMDELFNEISQNGGVCSGYKDPFELDSIDTPDKLAAQVRCLTDFNSFLDDHLSTRTGSPTYKANLLLMKVPIKLEVDQETDGTHFMVMAATNLVTEWSRGENRRFVLTGLTVASP
jgi:hypothetical protein